MAHVPLALPLAGEGGQGQGGSVSLFEILCDPVEEDATPAAAAAAAAAPAAAPVAAPASPAAAAADDTVQGENRGPKPGELEAEDKFYNEGKEAGIGGIIKNGGGKSRKRIRRHKPVVRATRKREYKPTIACNKYKMARSIKKKMAARSIKK